jgi:hypothetical protein
MRKRLLAAADKPWFKRGRAGVGYRPQTWQGWASLTAFLVVLAGSVELVQAILGEDRRGQSIAFIVAAVEIMGFMKFMRGRVATPPETTTKK